MGGTEPTITDANVILGYLNPARLAGGAVKLNAARAHEVFEEKVARRLGMPLVEAAHGAHLIAASNMMRAIRAVSSERGRDPREYALFAFGGNGPLFAAGMAEQLEMRRIVVPPAPGLFSSFGLLYADVEHHYVRTWRRLVREADPAALGDLLRRMEEAARAQLGSEGFPGDRIRVRRSADCRYHGQSFELTVPMPDGAIQAGTLAALAEAFGQEHERTYGHRAGADEPVEIVNLRVVAQGLSDRPRVPEQLRTDRPGGAGETTRRVYFGRTLGWRETPILDRPALATPREGPCVIEEYDATCVVPPGARAMLDAYGNIAIELGREI
jgi:N-methylhydantoinase A